MLNVDIMHPRIKGQKCISLTWAQVAIFNVKGLYTYLGEGDDPVVGDAGTAAIVHHNGRVPSVTRI